MELPITVLHDDTLRYLFHVSERDARAMAG